MGALTGSTNDPADAARLAFEGDVLILNLVGEVGVPDMRRMIDMGEELFARHGYILILGDAKRVSGLHPDARKLQADRLKRFIRPSHTAIYRVHTIIRVMSTLTQKGVELMTGKTYPVSFHKDEAEARAEIDRQRIALQKSVAKG